MSETTKSPSDPGGGVSDAVVQRQLSVHIKGEDNLFRLGTSEIADRAVHLEVLPRGVFPFAA